MNSTLKRWAKEESEIPVHEETITVNFNGEEKDFELIHNFNWFNLDIIKAVDEWAKQTYTPTCMDFCRYVMHQATAKIKLVCIPKQAWIEFQMEQEFNPSQKKPKE